VPDFIIAQDPITAIWWIGPGHALQGIMVKVATTNGPTQHPLDITKDTIGLDWATSTSHGVNHSVHISAVQVSEPDVADDGNDVLSDPSLNALSAAQIGLYVLGEVTLAKHRDRHAAGLLDPWVLSRMGKGLGFQG
jgi:hypothetical protein